MPMVFATRKVTIGFSVCDCGGVDCLFWWYIQFCSVKCFYKLRCMAENHYLCKLFVTLPVIFGVAGVHADIISGTKYRLLVMITQCAVLFAFLAVGELIVWATGVPVPSSIIGMLLLAAALRLKVVKLRHVEGVADFLVRNLGFFFVPAGVGVMRCMGIIRDQWLPIVGATVVSTFVIIAVTGWVHQLVRRYFSHISIHGHGISSK